MKSIQISGNDVLIIKNCLNYCKHRLKKHGYCGLTKTDCQVEHIEKVLKNLPKPQEQVEIESIGEGWDIFDIKYKVDQLISVVNRLTRKVG